MATATDTKPEELDVVIIGAGLSGINSAYRLKEAFPSATFAILEKRSVIGGTWAFWQYPGVRSDSSLAVFGFPWYPWPHDLDFAPAHLIKEYLEEAAASQGIDKAVRFNQEVTSSSWSSAEQRWTLRATSKADDGKKEERLIRAGWVFHCGGYYDYDHPRKAEIPGLSNFAGEVVHPQFWKPEISYAGKRIVIIGSGATAVTLLPNLTEKAAHVTMLQRSPSFVQALPSSDMTTIRLRHWLGPYLAMRVNWIRRLLIEVLFVHFFLLTFPQAGRRFLTKELKKRLPPNFPVEEHFNPRYNPFQQRLCFTPDGDFFDALARPNCDVVTAVIDTCDEKGIVLKDGKGRLDADMIITATGLHMEMLGGKAPEVDGVKMVISERYVWRSCMLDGVPNSCAVMGYTAGTWTPGADVHVRTVLNVMRRQRQLGASSVRPHIDPAEREKMPNLPVVPHQNSTYILEARARMPRSAGRDPWRNGQHWLADAWGLWFGGVTKGLRYTILC